MRKMLEYSKETPTLIDSGKEELPSGKNFLDNQAQGGAGSEGRKRGQGHTLESFRLNLKN